MNTVEDRSNLLKHLVDLGQRRGPDLADTDYELPADRYTDVALFEDEVQFLFREHPSLVAFSSELPKPGDYRVVELCGVSVVLLRGKDGQLRGFRNTCVHRASLVVTEERGCGLRRMSCPFHGWTYDDRGRLVGVPSKLAFPRLPKDELGLQAVQVEEVCGLVFVQLEGDSTLDVRNFLGPYVVERLEAIGLDSSWDVAGPERVEVQGSWKVMVDTFGEGYHFPILHRQSLGDLALGGALSFERVGRHVRQALPAVSLLDLADDPHIAQKAAGGKDFFEIFVIFPNVDFQFSEDSIDVYVIQPASTIDKCHLDHYTLYSPTLDPPERYEIEEFVKWGFNNVLLPEDVAQVTRVWKGLNAGGVDTVHFGRNESTLHALHDYYAEVVAAGRAKRDQPTTPAGVDV